MLRNPKPHSEFRNYRKRLALFYHAANHTDYWREYWSPAFRQSLIKRGQAGHLGEFETLITRYVSKDQPVLEAGCGPAHYVAALKMRGYKSLGVELEPEVVRFVNETLPSLDVNVGDVTALNFETASIGAYLSFGVVEHFAAGPMIALAEARRVLHREGVALISVPYLNPARRDYLQKVPQANEEDKQLKFHQYYFSYDDFRSLLSQAGLNVIDHYPYALKAFLTREHMLFTRLWKSPLSRGGVKRRFRHLMELAPLPLREKYGHMMMFVCRPA